MNCEPPVVLLIIRNYLITCKLNEYFGVQTNYRYNQIFPLFYLQKKIIYIDVPKINESQLIIETHLKNTLIEGKLIQIYIVSDSYIQLDKLNKLNWLQLYPQLHQITQQVIINKNYNYNHNENILYFQNIEELLIKIGQLQQNQQQIIYKQDFIFNQDKSYHQEKFIEQLRHIEQEIETYNQFHDILVLLNKIIYVRQNLFYEVAAKIKPSNQQLLIQYQDSLELKFNLDVLDQLQQTTLQIINQINKLIEPLLNSFCFCTKCNEIQFKGQSNKIFILQIDKLNITKWPQSQCCHTGQDLQSRAQRKIKAKVDELITSYNYSVSLQNIKNIQAQKQIFKEHKQMNIQTQLNYIIIFGKAESGKTTIFNKLCQNQEIDHIIKNGLNYKMGKFYNQEFQVIDTPGFERFNENNIEDTQLMNSFGQMLQGKLIKQIYFVIKFQRIAFMKEQLSDLLIPFDQISKDKISIIVSYFDKSTNQYNDKLQIQQMIKQYGNYNLIFSSIADQEKLQNVISQNLLNNQIIPEKFNIENTIFQQKQSNLLLSQLQYKITDSQNNLIQKETTIQQQLASLREKKLLDQQQITLSNEKIQKAQEQIKLEEETKKNAYNRIYDNNQIEKQLQKELADLQNDKKLQKNQWNKATSTHYELNRHFI